MKKAELIFIPLPGSSHLLPALEFANRLMDRDDRISITVLFMKLPYGDHAKTKSIAAAHSRIRFVDVPESDPPPMQLLMTTPELFFSLFTEKNVPQVRNIIREIVSTHSDLDSVRVTGLVVDIAFFKVMEVAAELGLPSYGFVASNLGCLSMMWSLSRLHGDDQIGDGEFQISDSDNLLTMPSFVNPVPVSVLPPNFLKKEVYNYVVEQVRILKDGNGIIFNTFSELESYALSSFSGGSNPPVFTVGPLLDLQVPVQPNQEMEESRSGKILKWLDEQPESSVVFLCFGMGGTFGPEQVKEIATGLEQSEYRFLWTLRVSSPPHQNIKAGGGGGGGDGVFPEGFMERIGGRGMICEWAPQVEVLAHKAVGGFVSHCGWNSIIESLCHGVPIAAWPLYAEQQFNAFMMVKELGLAVDVKSSSSKMDGGLVTADEVATAVRHVMDGDSEIRKKTKEMAEISRKSLMEGGSSFISTGQFVNLNFS